MYHPPILIQPIYYIINSGGPMIDFSRKSVDFSHYGDDRLWTTLNHLNFLQ